MVRHVYRGHKMQNNNTCSNTVTPRYLRNVITYGVEPHRFDRMYIIFRKKNNNIAFSITFKIYTIWHYIDIIEYKKEPRNGFRNQKGLIMNQNSTTHTKWYLYQINIAYKRIHVP